MNIKYIFWTIIIVLLLSISMFFIGRTTKECIEEPIVIENYDSLKSEFNKYIEENNKIINKLELSLNTITLQHVEDSIKMQKKIQYYFNKVQYYKSISQDSNCMLLLNKYKIDDRLNCMLVNIDLAKIDSLEAKLLFSIHDNFRKDKIIEIKDSIIILKTEQLDYKDSIINACDSVLYNIQQQNNQYIIDNKKLKVWMKRLTGVLVISATVNGILIKF